VKQEKWLVHIYFFVWICKKASKKQIILEIYVDVADMLFAWNGKMGSKNKGILEQRNISHSKSSFMKIPELSCKQV
jgi:hypothetical protein